MGIDIAVNCVIKSLSLSFAAYEHKNLPCAHNRFNAHCVSLTGYLVTVAKKSFVCFNGAFGQINSVGERNENVVGLVKSDMAVGAHAKKL